MVCLYFQLKNRVNHITKFLRDTRTRTLNAKHIKKIDNRIQNLIKEFNIVPHEDF